jgi:hypothetical protein
MILVDAHNRRTGDPTSPSPAGATESPFGQPDPYGPAARQAAEEDLTPDRQADPLAEPPRWSQELLRECARDFRALSNYRQRRKEARDDYRGYQWERTVEDPDHPGQMVKEKDLIERQGRVPLKMNHIAPVIRHLKGELLQNESDRMAYAVDRDDTQAAEQMTVARRAVRRANREEQLEADQFEEHLLSGMHAWKVSAGYLPKLDRNEVETDVVDVTRLFFNRDVSDRCLKNLRRIGEIHEVTIDELVEQLAEDPDHEERIRDVYADKAHPLEDNMRPEGFDATDAVDFYYPTDPAKARVFEVWFKRWEWVTLAHDPLTGDEALIDWTDAEIALENEVRAEMGVPPLEVETQKEPVWHYAFLSPQGHVLDTGSTPFWHQEHPYIVAFAQFRDGEFWGLVEDIQDPQRLINRITSAIDFMMAASAKGVLLVDEDVLEDSEMNIDDIAEKWTSFNGVIALKPKGNQTVGSSIEQVTAAAVPAGLFEWLASQKQWVEELSGVLGAQQGHAPPSGTPASLYAQQQVQASLTTLVFFETFFGALYDLDRKAIQTIAQFYDQPRKIATGKRAPLVDYDPERVREIDFDVVLADTADTATFRLQFEESLSQFLEAGYITFPQFLEVSAHPKAQQLQKLIQRTNPLLQGVSALDRADPELAGALLNAAEAGDMEARTLLMQAEQTPASGMEAAVRGRLGMQGRSQSPDVMQLSQQGPGRTQPPQIT